MTPTERIVRIVFALVIFGLGVYFESWWGLVGLIPLLTGAFGFCPLKLLRKNQECPLGICALFKKAKD